MLPVRMDARYILSPTDALPVLGRIPDHTGMTTQIHASLSQETHMDFLSVVGKDVKAVFKWLGSPKGQAIIHTGEAIVTTIEPQLAGIVGLADSWIQKVIATEALAAAAGQQTGSSTAKAAAVMTAMSPEIALYFPAATAAQIRAANDAIVSFLNAFDGAASPVAGV